MCSTFTHLKRFSRRALDSEKSRLQNFRKTPNSLKSICITARLIASTRDELSPLKVKWRKQQVLKIIHKLKRSGQSNLPFIAYFLPHPSLHPCFHSPFQLWLSASPAAQQCVPFPFVSVILSLLCATNAACSQFVSILLKLPRFTKWLGDLFEN